MATHPTNASGTRPAYPRPTAQWRHFDLSRRKRKARTGENVQEQAGGTSPVVRGRCWSAPVGHVTLLLFEPYLPQGRVYVEDEFPAMRLSQTTRKQADPGTPGVQTRSPGDTQGNRAAGR